MKFSIAFLTLCSLNAFAQVGIGTTTPNASLEITASNPAAPSNTDGLLLPKIDEFPVTNPTALQDGMMVYATGNGSVSKGFYFWDENSISWQTTSGSKRIDDLIDGKSDASGSSTFLGQNAGSLDNGTDNNNIGIGLESLMSNTNGPGNIGIGYQSLLNLDNGISNIAIGSRAMRFATGGQRNIAIGGLALDNNSSGIGNIALGQLSLANNTTGEYNIAIGAVSLDSNNSGNRNISIGVGSMNVNQNGSNNIAFGFNTGYFVEGDNNILIGEGAGGSGDGSGTHSKSGSVFIGHNAGATEVVSNRLYIENTDSTTPLIYGEFDNDIVGFNGDVAIGHQSPEVPLHIINEGTADVQNIIATLASNTSNRPVLLFSETVNSDFSSGMSLEYDGRGTGTVNRMSINNIGGNPLFEFSNGGSFTMNSGSLYVNHPTGSATEGLILTNTTDTDSWRLYHQWNTNTLALFFNGTNVGNFDDVSGAYTAISDRRLKTNISPKLAVLDKVMELEVVDYQFKNQVDSKKYQGFIAQDVEKLFPEIVVPPSEENENYTMDYSGFGVLAIKAIQEQQKEIESLQLQLENQNKEIQEIKELLLNHK